MNQAVIFHPDALPAFGTPEFPVVLTQRVAEPGAAFVVRVLAMADHLAERSGVGPYVVELKESK